MHNTDWIESLSPAARQEVKAALVRRSFADGQIVYSAGQQDRWSFRVVSGVVHISEIDEDGKEFLLVAFGPGNCFGVMQAIDGGPYPQFATAHGPVTLDCLSGQAMNSLRQKWPEIDRALALWVVRRLREAMRMLRRRTTRDLRCQLAGQIDFLLEYIDREIAPEKKTRLQLPLTQEVLGSTVGATRQAVSAVLREWADAGIVQYQYGKLTVLNREKLRALARDD